MIGIGFILGVLFAAWLGGAVMKAGVHWSVGALDARSFLHSLAWPVDVAKGLWGPRR
jgi:hypothetical protein